MKKPHRSYTFLPESIRVSLKDNCGAFIMLGEFPRMFPELIGWNV